MPATRESRSTPYGIRVGRLRGVPIYLGRSWFFIAVIVVVLFGPQVQQILPDLGGGAYIVAFLYTLLLLVSVLVHEAAHALVGQARGYVVDRIVADLWGGHTAYASSSGSPLSSALVAGVGPLSNLLLAGLGWIGLQSMPTPLDAQSNTVRVVTLLLTAFVWANGFVGLFNLLPGLPLDGGFLLEALVWRITGSRATGMRAAGWVGRIVAVAVIYLLGIRPLIHGNAPSPVSIMWILLIGMFLWQGAGAAVAGGRGLDLLGRVRVTDLLRPVAVAPAPTPISELDSRDTVVVDPASGAPTGFAPGEAILAARGQAPHAALGSVMTTQPTEWLVQVDDAGTDVTELVRAVQSTPAEVARVLVIDRNHRVLGIVRTDDLDHALRHASRAR